MLYFLVMTDGSLTPARRAELIQKLAAWLCRWNLSEPAIVLLALHLPLAFLGSQLLIAGQPFLVTWLDDRLLHDLALFFEAPENIEQLIEYLEHPPETKSLSNRLYRE